MKFDWLFNTDKYCWYLGMRKHFVIALDAELFSKFLQFTFSLFWVIFEKSLIVQGGALQKREQTRKGWGATYITCTLCSFLFCLLSLWNFKGRRANQTPPDNMILQPISLNPFQYEMLASSKWKWSQMDPNFYDLSETSRRNRNFQVSFSKFTFYPLDQSLLVYDSSISFKNPIYGVIFRFLSYLRIC